MNDLPVAGNEPIYLSADSILAMLFEQRLMEANIVFLRQDTFHKTPGIKYTFYLKDLENARQILAELEWPESKSAIHPNLGIFEKKPVKIIIALIVVIYFLIMFIREIKTGIG